VTRLPNSVRLWCFPYAGASASLYHGWKSRLVPSVEVRGVELPGRGARFLEPPLTRLPPLVRLLADELEPHLASPYAFYGHSLGGLLAFELARELRRRERPQPVHLFVAGCWPPDDRGAPTFLHRLGDADFVEVVRRFGAMPAEVLEDDELLACVIDALRADFEVAETYEYGDEPPLDCGISVLWGQGDNAVLDLTAWRRQTRGAFSIRLLRGPHLFLHSSLDSVLEAIERDLAAYPVRAERRLATG
jgi:medium-chain acyl-[acyl-carrier-protein] hydrolase